MVLSFIQYSGEAFGAPWEQPAGEVAVKGKIWTPRQPYPELISGGGGNIGRGGTRESYGRK